MSFEGSKLEKDDKRMVGIGRSYWKIKRGLDVFG